MPASISLVRSRIRQYIRDVFANTPNVDLESYDLDLAISRFSLVAGDSGDLTGITAGEFWAVMDECERGPATTALWAVLLKNGRDYTLIQIHDPSLTSPDMVEAWLGVTLRPGLEYRIFPRFP